MKKIIREKVQEESEYLDDFNDGVVYTYGLPVSINIDCGYGSDLDGLEFEFHCGDDTLKKLLLFLQDQSYHNISDNCNNGDVNDTIDNTINDFCKHHRILKIKKCR